MVWGIFIDWCACTTVLTKVICHFLLQRIIDMYLLLAAINVINVISVDSVKKAVSQRQKAVDPAMTSALDSGEDLVYYYNLTNDLLEYPAKLKKSRIYRSSAAENLHC